MKRKNIIAILIYIVLMALVGVHFYLYNWKGNIISFIFVEVTLIVYIALTIIEKDDDSEKKKKIIHILNTILGALAIIGMILFFIINF